MAFLVSPFRSEASPCLTCSPLLSLATRGQGLASAGPSLARAMALRVACWAPWQARDTAYWSCGSVWGPHSSALPPTPSLGRLAATVSPPTPAALAEGREETPRPGLLPTFQRSAQDGGWLPPAWPDPGQSPVEPRMGQEEGLGRRLGLPNLGALEAGAGGLGWAGKGRDPPPAR